MSLTLMYITNNCKVAVIAERAGIDRIFIDLEVIGKKERQQNVDSVKSDHKISDIEVLRGVLNRSKILVRINPLHSHSKNEIDSVIGNGAEIIMLPMWRTVDQVKYFVDLVRGRAKTMLLLETIDAEKNIGKVLTSCNIDEIHIGLNDLHLEYKLKFMFQLLASDTFESTIKKIKSKGIPFGFGGIAGLEGGLISGKIIIAEHYRLKSTMAIVSRSFCNTDKISDMESIENIFINGINEIRKYEQHLQMQSESFFEDNRRIMIEQINEIVKCKS